MIPVSYRLSRCGGREQAFMKRNSNQSGRDSGRDYITKPAGRNSFLAFSPGLLPAALLPITARSMMLTRERALTSHRARLAISSCDNFIDDRK
jgi:hypothetical protein